MSSFQHLTQPKYQNSEPPPSFQFPDGLMQPINQNQFYHISLPQPMSQIQSIRRLPLPILNQFPPTPPLNHYESSGCSHPTLNPSIDQTNVSTDPPDSPEMNEESDLYGRVNDANEDEFSF